MGIAMLKPKRAAASCKSLALSAEPIAAWPRNRVEQAFSGDSKGRDWYTRWPLLSRSAIAHAYAIVWLCRMAGARSTAGSCNLA
jgi:hypothetical protein